MALDRAIIVFLQSEKTYISMWMSKSGPEFQPRQRGSFPFFSLAVRRVPRWWA
jgi:hypothetical protein